MTDNVGSSVWKKRAWPSMDSHIKLSRFKIIQLIQRALVRSLENVIDWLCLRNKYLKNINKALLNRFWTKSGF